MQIKYRIGIMPGQWPAGPDGRDLFWRVIETCERTEIDSIWFSDRLSSPIPVLEPIIAMAAVAARTQRPKFGPSVLVAPFRAPVLAARQLAMLDYLSGGRALPAVGIGVEQEREFRAAGVPFKERGRRTDEAIRIMRRCWAEDEVTHEGEFWKLERVTVLPKPVQQPMPLWIGGNSEAAMRRAGRLGDGWIPSFITPEQFRAGVEKTCAFAAEARRDGPLRAPRSAGLEDLDQEVRVDVASREDHADARASRDRELPGEDRGGAHRARWLDDDPGAQREHAHGRDDLRIGHEAHARQALAEDRERERARARDADPVGDRRWRRDGDALALLEREVRVVRGIGLDADHRDSREETLRHGGAARHEPAAAHRGHEGVERGDVLKELERRRPLARHDRVVVVRRYEHAPRLRRDALGERRAVVFHPVVEDDLGAVVAGRLDLERRRVGRHADDRARADHPRGQRDALSVVARRVRDDAARTLRGGERQQLVQRAADLEGSRALEILALERHAVAARVVERL